MQEDENGKVGWNLIVKLLSVRMGRLEIILGKRIHSRILTQIFYKLYDNGFEGISLEVQRQVRKVIGIIWARRKKESELGK